MGCTLNLGCSVFKAETVVNAYGPRAAEPQEEPSFGTHIKEAVGIVKDWVGNKQR
jgi:hypothetical protein